MLWPIIVPLTPKSLAFLAFGSLSWQAVRDGSGHDGHWEGGFCHSWGLWCNTLALCLQEAFSPLPLPHAHMLMSLSQIRSPWKAAWEQYFARSCVFMQVCPYSLYLKVSFAVYEIHEKHFLSLRILKISLFSGIERCYQSLMPVWHSRLYILHSSDACGVWFLEDTVRIQRIGKVPWRRAWQPTPVFLPEYSWSWLTEQPGRL